MSAYDRYMEFINQTPAMQIKSVVAVFVDSYFFFEDSVCEKQFANEKLLNRFVYPLTSKQQNAIVAWNSQQHNIWRFNGKYMSSQ